MSKPGRLYIDPLDTDPGDPMIDEDGLEIQEEKDFEDWIADYDEWEYLPD